MALGAGTPAEVALFLWFLGQSGSCLRESGPESTMAGLDTSNLSGVTSGFADLFRRLVEAVSPLSVCLVTVLYSGEGASVSTI